MFKSSDGDVLETGNDLSTSAIISHPEEPFGHFEKLLKAYYLLGQGLGRKNDRSNPKTNSVKVIRTAFQRWRRGRACLALLQEIYDLNVS